MPVSFFSKSRKTLLLIVEVDRELNLLAHAQLEELSLGSRCGGHGKCGGDRIKILKSSITLSPLTRNEIAHLNDKEIKAGYRLACQVWPEASDSSTERVTLDVEVDVT